ncbi:MAG: MBL fold metallo-hydrolase [Firmicutes bacterium]|jgi:competence protein ComEC|nr:MBL fold metallo-hydrolase [Bacillota bacterium]
MRRRLSVLVLALVLVFSAVVWAEQPVDRYDQVFDASQDAGRLTARFLKLTTRSDDKSGDSTILTSPDGKVMVIDAGNPSTFIDVDKALKALGITKIDYLVSSHPHVDHIGSFAQLIYAYDIGAVYTSEVEYPSSHYRNYMEAMKQKGTPHVILAEGDTFMFGDHVLVEVFHPAPGIEYYEGYPEGSTQFINNHSLLMKFTYGDSTFLFTGDLYTAAEREIVDRYGDRLSAGVLKVPHHGDKTSSSRPLRDAVGAQIAVMMHDAIADLRIYRNYSKAGTDTYITSIDGAVMVSTAGDGEYTVLSQFDRLNDFLD